MRQLVSALLIGVGAAALNALTASGATTLRVATLNLCGSVCLEGELSGTASAVSAQAKALNLDAFVLNEVCAGQYDAIKAKLGSGWTTYYTTTVGHGPCQTASAKTDDRFGNAILVRGKVSDKAVTDLPWGKAPSGSKGREPRSLLCADAVIRTRTLELCTTHLSPDATDRADQAAVVVSKTKPISAAGSLVLAGDFNAAAGSTVINNFDSYLNSTNSSHLGTDAADKEIDWIFTDAAVPAPATTAADNAGGDHRWLIGTLSL